MAFVTGVTLKCLVNQYDLSGYFNALAPSFDRSMYDTTVFGNTSKNGIPGLKSGMIDIGGLYEAVATASAPDNVFNAIEASATVPLVSIYPEGWTVPNRVYLLQAHKQDHKISAIVDDLVKITANFTDNDGYDFGVSLHGLTAETSLPVTGTTVDNGAATANGGVAFLHASAIAGGAPNIVYKVQDSANGSSWADIITFTAVTAAGAQRSIIASGTTVRQFLRMTATEGGTTTSVTGAVSFARR